MGAESFEVRRAVPPVEGSKVGSGELECKEDFEELPEEGGVPLGHRAYQLLPVSTFSSSQYLPCRGFRVHS